MNYLFLLGSIQAIFLAIILFANRRDSLPNRVLLIWMLALGVNLFGSFCASTGYFERRPYLFGYDTTLVLLNGPLAFLYVTYYIGKIRVPRIKNLIHFLPYTFYTIYFILKIRTRGHDFESIKRLIYEPDIVMLSMQINIHLLLVVYILFIFLRLRERKSNIEEAYSFKDGVDLQWMKNILWPLMLIAMFTVLGIISSDLFAFSTQDQKANMFYGFLALLPFYITFQAIRHRIFRIGTTSQIEDKYSRSSLTSIESLEIMNRLEVIMEKEKPYLDSYLSIDKLAVILQVHPKNLSRVINEHKEVNFFNYINGYRVKEVKARLNNKTYQHFTILAIALDSGFNTKSAFNNTFKKMTGSTPSEFKKRLNSQKGTTS